MLQLRFDLYIAEGQAKQRFRSAASPAVPAVGEEVVFSNVPYRVLSRTWHMETLDHTVVLLIQQAF